MEKITKNQEFQEIFLGENRPLIGTDVEQLRSTKCKCEFVFCSTVLVALGAGMIVTGAVYSFQGVASDPTNTKIGAIVIGLLFLLTSAYCAKQGWRRDLIG